MHIVSLLLVLIVFTGSALTDLIITGALTHHLRKV
jgi:hypothetical protein